MCPTGAIQPIEPAQKLGTEGFEAIRLGTAFYNRGRCLPWAMDVPCIVCEEWCPTTPKAIWVEEVEVTRERKEGAEVITIIGDGDAAGPDLVWVGRRQGTRRRLRCRRRRRSPSDSSVSR